MIKVTVVIPVYNVENYIEKCLKSVTNQTLKEIEIICVDDCSQDKSLDIVKRYAANDERIIIFNRSTNGGLSAARNSGLTLAKGKYVYFIDSDDWIDIDYIEKMYFEAMKNDVEIVLNTNIIKTFENSLPDDFFVWKNYNKKNTIGEILSTDFSRFNTQCMTWCHLYKKEFITQYNIMFPEGYIHEDNYFKAISELYTNKIFAFYGSAYYYLQRKNSIMTTRTDSLKPRVQILQKIFDYYIDNGFQNKLPYSEFLNLSLTTYKTEYHYNTAKSFLEKYFPYFEKKINTTQCDDIIKNNTILESSNFNEYVKKYNTDWRISYLRNKIKLRSN